MVNLFNSWSTGLLCPDLPDPSSLTERIPDNQRHQAYNDTTFVAKHSTPKSQLD